MTNYEILDANGVIHSSSDKEEMISAFDCMINPDEYDQEKRDMWESDWTGDLKLVAILLHSK